jgi:hypothetical protein
VQSRGNREQAILQKFSVLASGTCDIRCIIHPPSAPALPAPCPVATVGLTYRLCRVLSKYIHNMMTLTDACGKYPPHKIRTDVGKHWHVDATCTDAERTSGSREQKRVPLAPPRSDKSENLSYGMYVKIDDFECYSVCTVFHI